MKIILFLLGILLNISVFAQEGKLSEEKRKEFEAQKVAFFTQQLDLTPPEAAVFWPLYNEMQKKIRELEGEMRKRSHVIRETKNLKEEDYKEAVAKMLADGQKAANLKKEYYVRIMQVIPASKVWKLDDAERKFHRQLFDRLRNEDGSRKKNS